MSKLQQLYGNFEDWVHSWWPGAKTRITAALGSIGMAAAALQGYVTGLPTVKYISAETLSLLGAGLFTLSYWFSGMGQRVDARAQAL